MANVFKVVVATQAQKVVQVVAETPEEAQAKVQLQEGESVINIEDGGEVTV